MAQRPTDKIKTTEKSSAKVQCDVCPKFYCNRKHMYRHMRTNHRIDPVTSEILPERKILKQKPKKKCESSEDEDVVEVNTTEYAVLKHRIPCQVCAKSFSQSRNMYQHMRRVHRVKATPVQVAKSERIRPVKRISCQMCLRTFADAGNMYRHVRKIHGILPRTQKSQGEFECLLCNTHFNEGHELKRHIKLAHSLSLSEDDSSDSADDSLQNAKKRIQCQICNREFNRTFNMHNHMRKRHKTEPAYRQLECPLCEFVCRYYITVLRHLKKHHGVWLEKERHKFNSMSDFNQWKIDLEQAQNVKFIEQTKPRIVKTKNRITSFLCDGMYKRGNKMKICPACIVMCDAGKIIINYYKTHICKRTHEEENDTPVDETSDTGIILHNKFNARLIKTEGVDDDNSDTNQSNSVHETRQGAMMKIEIETDCLTSKIQEIKENISLIKKEPNQNQVMFKCENKNNVDYQNIEAFKESSATLLIIRDHYECAACKEIFYHRDKLIRHLTLEHLQKFNIKSEAVQDKSTMRPRVPCQICSQTFTSCVNMYKHMRVRHRSEPTFNKARGNLVCPLCTASVQFHKTLIEHLEAVHDVTIEQEVLMFESLADFEQWRTRIELEHGVYYVKRTKTKSNTIFLFCHRSGRAKRDSNKTIKMGKTCPARIILYTDGAHFRAKHYKTHICTTTLCVEDKKGRGVCERCGKVVSKKNILRHYRDAHGIG